MALNELDAVKLRQSLEQAVKDCHERCLFQSAKWLAELLNCIPDQTSTSSLLESDGPQPTQFDSQERHEEAKLESKEKKKFMLAQTYFRSSEYARCAAVFLPHPYSNISLPDAPPNLRKPRKTDTAAIRAPELTDPLKLSQKSLFLSLYAKFILGEKRKHEGIREILGPLDGYVQNGELYSICQQLAVWFRAREVETSPMSNRQSVGWLEYLYGIALAKNGQKQVAREWLVKSVSIYPWNWSAWVDLGGLIDSSKDLFAIQKQLPPHIMTTAFYVHTSQGLYQSDQTVVEQLELLQKTFPDSLFLDTQRALLTYHRGSIEEAKNQFSKLLQADPFRLDSLDHYSNLLHSMELQHELAFVAGRASTVDRFRPEVCCVLGNYYSSRNDHVKAVEQFRKALTLDREYATAWTLLGHEYALQRNLHAAMAAYHKAVEINPKDYRAWYGLGRSYQAFDHLSFAAYYHKRAALLRPNDSRLWKAVAECFEQKGKWQLALRAISHAILDAYAAHMFARLYERLNLPREAANYMQMCIDFIADEEFSSMETDDEANDRAERVAYMQQQLDMLKQGEVERVG